MGNMVTKVTVPDSVIDHVINSLQGMPGWLHRHLPSKGHWIEFEEDADQARVLTVLTV